MSQKPRIVFVDDEVNILNGIRRSLRGMRANWDMEFFTSGQAALDGLSKAPAEVVVSDMRMPEMDGAQLLSQVKDRWPQTVRFILSGFSNEEAILRTIGPSHQYLAKPCESETLISAIERSINVRKLLGDTALSHIIDKIDAIPVLPEHLLKIIELTNQEKTSIREIGDLIAEDIALSASLLKLTNSAYFGLPTTITDPRKAVSLLGFETVKAVVLLAIVNTQIKTTEHTEHDMHQINVRSLEISQMANRIATAEKLPKDECDEVMCIGILMHVGSLLLLSQFSGMFARVTEYIDMHKSDICTAERAVFKTDHGAVGAYLLGLWGFNDNIVDSVFHHHEPSKSSTSLSILKCVHAAQYLGKRIDTDDPEACEGLLDNEFIERAKLRPKLEEWATLCQSVVKP